MESTGGGGGDGRTRAARECVCEGRGQDVWRASGEEDFFVFLFCFVLFCFVLFCFVLFLFCFILFLF